MDWQQFEMGFWHPFGPHANESMDQILFRKAREIAANGWTLWSFKYRSMLDAWHRELTSANPNPDKVWVFCSAGGGDDPFDRGGSQVIDCRSYRPVGESAWLPLPEAIRVPHVFRPGQQQRASVFLVEDIIHPIAASSLPDVWWFSKGGWRKYGLANYRHGLPTRDVYLVRPDGLTRMRRCAAVLKLKPPYLAVARTNRAVPEEDAIFQTGLAVI